MSHKVVTVLLASGLSFLAMVALAGCPPNAYHVLTLMVTPIEAGTIALDPDKAVYFAGEEVVLEAIPNEGFTFHRWVGTGINTTINPTKKRVYADETIVAEFSTEAAVPEGEAQSEGETETETVKNGTFENGGENWTQASLTGMDLVCDIETCTGINGINSADGTHWAWFGNGGTFNYESATLFQEITLPVLDEAYLKFYLAMPKTEMPFTFQVLFNSVVLLELTEEDSLLFGNYQPVSVDISDFADGQTAVLTFLYTSMGAFGEETALFVDDVVVE